MIKNTLTLYNVKTGAKSSFVCKGAIRMKHAAIIDENHIVALSSDKGPINGSLGSDKKVRPVNIPYDSHIHIYNIHTGELIQQYTYKETQIDACVYDLTTQYIYVTCTDIKGKGYIWRSKIIDYLFTDMQEISCAGFPHGISIYNNIIAFTSYETSAVYIHRIDLFGGIESI
jgi:hypothetical protein